MTAGNPSLVLYGEKFWYSPYVFTAFVALKEKGLEFETKVLDLARGDQSAAAYRDQSLTARVPALDHDGFVFSESTAIVEYLEEAFPAPKWPRLLPESVKDRARARQLMAWIRSDLMPLREERSTETMFFGPATKPLGTAAEAAAAKLLFAVDRLLEPGQSSLFASFSIADADLAFILHRLILSRDPVPAKVRDYAEAQWKRPSVQAFVEHERPRP
jgi:glutathione S-transferase